MNDRALNDPSRRSALEERHYSSIASHLIELGYINQGDISSIVDEQQRSGLPFGEAAVRRRLITDEDLRAALARQRWLDARTKDSPELVVASQPGHRAAELVRTLRAQINVRTRAAAGCRQLAIVSTERGEGRSFIAANLALAFAQSRVSTLLIDMDLRHPRQHAIFGLPNEQGLSTLLAGEAGPAQFEYEVGAHESLSVLTAGPIAPNPQELLQSNWLPQIQESLRYRYEMIIADTPAWDSAADAQLVTALYGCAVLVCRPARALRSRTASLLDAIDAGGGRVLGAVMNAV